jgi:Exonuclease
VCGHYKDWPLYDPQALDQLDPAVLTEVVADRKAWLAASLPRRAAAAELGWQLPQFDQVVSDRGVTPGRWGRYARSDLEVLAADQDLAEQVAADRCSAPSRPPPTWRSAGPTSTTPWPPAGSRRPSTSGSWLAAAARWRCRCTGPATSTRCATCPGWTGRAVRACRPGEPSPLRAFAPRPPSRAQTIRRFVAQLGDRYGVEVWAWYHGGADRWEVDWEASATGEPTVAQVAAAIAADPEVAQYRPDIVVATDGGAAVRWARAMLAPGAAVILDTETTDLPGAICDIAVVDAATGAVLLDSLVDPRAPITLGASWVHGLTDAEVAGAPCWPEVLPQLLEVTRGRQILAYNAEFDAGVIRADCHRYGLDPGPLGDADRWGCLMTRRSDWARRRRWLPLEGGHRAFADAHAALDVLRTLAAYPGPVRTGRRRARRAD